MYVTRNRDNFYNEEVSEYHLTGTDKVFFESSATQLRQQIKNVENKICNLTGTLSIKDARIQSFELNGDERMLYYRLTSLIDNLIGQLDYVKSLLDQDTFNYKMIERMEKEFGYILEDL